MATNSTTALGGMPPKVSDTTQTDTSKSGAARSKIAKDMNTFLTLLTTQLKYQDPLSPMDSSKFTDQLVQFANVEQNIQTNTNLESLINMQTGNQAAAAINYLGATIEADTDSLPLQSGKAEFSYTLPQECGSASLVIRDSTGMVVHSGSVEQSAGKHTGTWDGKDNFGFPLDDGVYEISVTGTTAEGEEVAATTTVVGKVSGVETSKEGKVMLSMAGVNVELGKIMGVRSSAATAAAPTTN
ncbi:MAG: hypothetical protein H7840_05810 [Alphaproteobacteria bacterium]